MRSIWLALFFSIFAHAQFLTPPGTIERMGLGPNGEPPDAFTAQPHLSFDGRYVMFSSKARNLLPGIPASITNENLYRQWYLFDRQTKQLERVSINSAGEIQQGPVFGTATGTDSIDISDDGRYVIFNSLATNLAQGGTPLILQVYLHDRVTKITSRLSDNSLGGGNPVRFIDGQTERVIFGCGSNAYCIKNLTNGSLDIKELPNPYRRESAVSKNGLYAVCSASGKALGINSGFDFIARCDLNTGGARLIEKRGEGLVDRVARSKFSSDGSILAFESIGPLDGSDPIIRPLYNIYLWRASTNTVELISKAPNGNSAFTTIFSGIALSDDGARISWVSQDSNLGPLSFFNFQSQYAIYVRDLNAVPSFTYYGALLANNNPGFANCEFVPIGTGSIFAPSTRNANCPELSGDGKVLAFSSHDWRWVPNDVTPQQGCGTNAPCSALLDVFVKNLGPTEPTVVVPVPLLTASSRILFASLMLVFGLWIVRRHHA